MAKHDTTDDRPFDKLRAGLTTDDQQGSSVVRRLSSKQSFCPFCRSTDSEVISLFGSQLLVSQRRCRFCGSYFEALRDDR